jgi:hypothetical protein
LPESPKQKLYCYVDETGQDTKGGLFLVALVVTDEQRGMVASEAERIEERTGKGALKWRKISFRQLRIGVRKVRGMKDESNSLLRLADAVCGLVRDYLEGQEYTKEFRWAFEKGILRKIDTK